MRVLIVEDEPEIADTLLYALETEGMSAAWCKTGSEGLQSVEDGDFDLVVLDVGLPDTDGFSLCREIRKFSDIPVLFLTARSDEVDRIVGLELGADDYVVKPFSPREVAARIRAIHRRTGGRESASSPLTIDFSRRKVTYFGDVLELTRYEYGILDVLARSPGRVFSREQIMDQVWTDPLESFERTVDAHIKTLRKKLRDARPDVDPIRTHRGVGYSLREEW